MTLQTNAIRGCQVTLEDAQIMWKICGPSVIKMKGNSTREKTIRNSSNIVAVPREFINAQKNVTVSVVFFLHQQVCVPNDSEQKRLFHNNEPL